MNKILYKIDSREWNSRPDEPIGMNVRKREMYSINNDEIIARTIIGSGAEAEKAIFVRQNMRDVILSNIEIQFALYQFYVLYSGLDQDEALSNGKLCGEIWYPEVKDRLDDATLSNFLSIFDSLHVVYKQDKTHVQTTLSNPDSKTAIYHIYDLLYKESLLNPFILSFLDEKRGFKFEGTGNAIYQYRPSSNDIDAVVLDEEELVFIEFIKRQLTRSRYFVFYCLGWNEEEAAGSKTLRKLAKHFTRIVFLSTPDRFLSQLLVISA